MSTDDEVHGSFTIPGRGTFSVINTDNNRNVRRRNTSRRATSADSAEGLVLRLIYYMNLFGDYFLEK